MTEENINVLYSSTSAVRDDIKKKKRLGFILTSIHEI